MSRPENTARKAAVSARYFEIKAENPLWSQTLVREALAAEFGVNAHTITYCLRSKDTPDRRVRYTAAEKERLAALSRKDLKAYADAKGLNFDALYATVWRHKTRAADTESTRASTRQVCEILGRLDVCKLADLRAHGFTKEQVKEARNVLKIAGSIELLPPNFLVHKQSRKFYILSLGEEIQMLTNPRRFLKDHAAHISANWKSWDPSTFYFVLVDTRRANPYHEGVCISTHDTPESACAAQHSHNLQPIVTPTAILRRAGGGGSRSLLRFKPGEIVPKYAPDVVPTSVLNFIPSDGFDFVPSAFQPSPPPTIEEPETHVEAGEYEVE